MKEKKQKPEKRFMLPHRSPRTWHGMTLGVWYDLLKRNRFAVSFWRWPLMGTVTLAAIVNSVLFWISRRVYGQREREVQLAHPPIFVIGHWRTGTTWFHELLVKDERLTFPTTYQCMAPYHFPLTEGVLPPCLNWTMPSKRPMDDMPVSMYRPQEDEFALMALGIGSPYLEWAFPNRGQRFDDYLTLTELPSAERQRWKEELDTFIRRITLKHPQRVVLKSPTHTARVRTLLELYPDARFIHIVRNPVPVVASTIRTWTRMTDAMSLQIRRDEVTVDRILDVFQRMYDQFERDRELIPPDHFYEIRYEDLVRDPLAEMERIYERLDLGDFAAVRPAMQEYLASIADYKPNKHSIPDDLKQKVQARCHAYIERYGYAEAVLK